VFDIGFTEIVLCLLVALVVIGPEQLPQTVRSVALWVGRLKRSLRDTREEIERQIGADDIRRQLHNEDIMRSLEETQRRITETMSNAQASVQQVQQDVQQALEQPATPPEGTNESTTLAAPTHPTDAPVTDAPATSDNNQKSPS
jgi:sec-independent protein translocase protein TatB